MDSTDSRQLSACAKSQRQSKINNAFERIVFGHKEHAWFRFQQGFHTGAFHKIAVMSIGKQGLPGPFQRSSKPDPDIWEGCTPKWFPDPARPCFRYGCWNP